MQLIAEKVAEVIGAKHLSGSLANIAGSVSTDTRSMPEGALWVALQGPNFDANKLCPQAAALGAAIAIVSQAPQQDCGDCCVLQVADTLQALQTLACWWRSQLPHLKVIAISGSNGKTSTKDFCAGLLGSFAPTFATAGNLNNHIGLPLSVLQIRAHHRFAVLEMGMNHAGELAPLCAIAKPDMGIISSIGTAHIEFLGSIEGIAEEKGSIAAAIAANGMFFSNAECRFFDYFSSRTQARHIGVGFEHGLYQAHHIQALSEGSSFDLYYREEQTSFATSIGIGGKHMVQNALLAAAVAHQCGMGLPQIAAQLPHCHLSHGRLHVYRHQGLCLIDDTYNANPDSLMAAMDTLAAMSLPQAAGRRVAVLGKFGELGDYAHTGYSLCGRKAAELELDLLVCVGEETLPMSQTASQLGCNIRHFDDQKQACEFLESYLRSGDAVLFKGSRSAGMERVLHALYPQLGQQAPATTVAE